jgi:hypothetical protein
MEALLSGDAEAVFEAAQALGTSYRNEKQESARLRFKLNFGSPLCSNCDGLKAGPGVIATCFQVQSCNFTNVKESDSVPRHLRVLERVLGGQDDG